MAEPPLVAVLAAGAGARFGGGKLDAPLAGKPLGRWALDAVAVAGLPAGMIVTGGQGAGFADGLDWELIANPHAHRGLGTSLALAASIAIERGRRALLVVLADMPLLDPGFLRQLSEAVPPTATRYLDRDPGVPALFGQAQLSALTALSGDRGAAALLTLMAGLDVLEPPPGMLRDVDRPEDLVELEQHLAR